MVKSNSLARDTYNNVQRQSLVEQQAVLEGFTPLEKALKYYSQASQVASAGGAALGTADICTHAQTMIGQSKKALSRLGRSTKSVPHDINDRRQLFEAAEKRLSAALAG